MRISSLALLAALLVPALPSAVRANDGAAELAVGGIQLRNERRVAMRKERLYISLGKVTVEYEFVNESKEDVVTEVAFPIPEYGYSPAYGIGHRFDDFRAWVAGQRVSVATEVKAFAKGREVTRELAAFGLDIAGMARADDFLERVEADGRGENVKWLSQIASMPPEKKKELRARGLIDLFGGDEFPAWTVQLTYHWLQHFPPGEVVRVRHEYRPMFGSHNVLYTGAFSSACVEPPLAKLIEGLRPVKNPDGWEDHGDTIWVKYILTTANTWKTPIRDFELVIEYPEGEYVSLCWDGKLERAGPRTFRSVLKDFVPKDELTVYFFRPPSAPLPPEFKPW